MKILHLTHKLGWFNMVAERIKTEEYREIKPYWFNRFLDNKTPHYDMWGESGHYNEALYALKKHLRGYNDLAEYLEHNELKFKEFDIVRFRNGYSPYSPVMDVEFKGFTVGTGNEQWGGLHPDSGEFVFILKLGKVLSIDRHDTILNDNYIPTDY